MEELINLLHSGGYSCVIANGDNIRTFTQRGVADLYDLLTQEPDFLKGASIADKVVGKGAAALMIWEVSGNFIQTSSVRKRWIYYEARI